MDNFFTGSKDNVAHLLPYSNFEIIRHDVVEPILLEVDQIYHLACPASPIHYKCAPYPQLWLQLQHPAPAIATRPAGSAAHSLCCPPVCAVRAAAAAAATTAGQ